jgi:hypothetical protein
MYIYVASSWRNPHQPAIVSMLRGAGHDVYDFRNPKLDDDGFRWSEIDPHWQHWSVDQYRQALGHPLAELGFAQDKLALQMADVTVLVLPCGRSAHLELGYAIGLKQRTAILMLEPSEPELMYKLADVICSSVDELLTWL